MKKLTRQQVARAFAAQYASAETASKQKQIVTALAALVIEEKMHNQIDVLLRDIIQAQTHQSGTLATQLTSRFELSDKVVSEISSQLKQLTGAKKVIFDSSTSEQILGGVRVQTPTAELDISLSRRLQDFKQAVSVS